MTRWHTLAFGRGRALRRRAAARVPVLIGILALAGCAPYVLPYKQVVFEPIPGLEVLARTPDALDSEGKALLFGKAGLPTNVRLTRSAYVIQITMQGGPLATVFLSARTPGGETLTIQGAYVHRVHPRSAMELEGFPYSFYTVDADGRPLTITISTADGSVQGVEQLNYSLQTYGYAVGIERA